LRAEGDFTVRRTVEGERRFLDEVEKVIVLVLNYNYTPPAGEGLRARPERVEWPGWR
jgi:hypothetical protein